MIKTIAERIINNYNKVIQYVNFYNIKEDDNFYGHVKEFIKLPRSVKADAHRVISTKALILYSNSIFQGSTVDINGNIYDFEIFSDGNYRISEVKKHKKISKEVANEKYFETDS